ncbi:periplasmic heavy metal sensor [Myxococcota bacterium]|nr:periplasmic heavy metal sensor [Myxococcota bacterium]
MTNEQRTSNTPNRSLSKLRIALGAGLVAAVVAIGGVAVAHPGGDGPRGGGFGPGRMIMRALRGLELTEQQELKGIQIRRNLQAQAKDAHQEMKGSLGKVATELEKASPDRAKLHGIADDVIKKMSTMAHSAIDQLLELHATFTPEQRTKLAAEIREMEQRAAELRDDVGPGKGPGKRGGRQ